MRPLQIVMACLLLAGCETPQAAVPVQPVTIKADTFCPVMRKLRPPDGIPTWDIAVDSPETVDYNRRLEAVVVNKCLASRPPANTTP